MKKLLCLAALLLTVGAPVWADEVMYSGIDLWRTLGDGNTFADFAGQPIPSGFFCNDSAAFTGKINFRGVPLVTGEPDALGRTDTIVQRLDDAVFNRRGIAVTRVQVRALTFEGAAPVRTSCGDYNVRVSLSGRQPITSMKIFRDDANGGRFLAPIAVNVKLSFTPVSGRGTTVSLAKSLRFAPDPRAAWAERGIDLNKSAVARTGYIKVDTDGDRVADTFVPGTSNFAAGWKVTGDKLTSFETTRGTVFHESPEHGHATVAE